MLGLCCGNEASGGTSNKYVQHGLGIYLLVSLKCVILVIAKLNNIDI